MNNNFKLLLYTENPAEPEEKGTWLDFYLNVSTIQGFYIPMLDDDEIPSINLLISGEFITILEQEHIVDYLNNRFGDNIKE